MMTLKILILRVFNELKRVKSKLMNIQLPSLIVKKKAFIDKVSVITSKFFDSQLFVPFKLLILKIKAHE